MKERERLFIDYRIRLRIEEAITYYFQHRDELSVVKLLNRFHIGLCDLGLRLYEIHLNYLETGELPFAAELNVDIDDFEQFRDALLEYQNYLERRLHAITDDFAPIASSTPFANGANRYALE